MEFQCTQCLFPTMDIYSWLIQKLEVTSHLLLRVMLFFYYGRSTLGLYLFLLLWLNCSFSTFVLPSIKFLELSNEE